MMVQPLLRQHCLNFFVTNCLSNDWIPVLASTASKSGNCHSLHRQRTYLLVRPLPFEARPTRPANRQYFYYSQPCEDSRGPQPLSCGNNNQFLSEIGCDKFLSFWSQIFACGYHCIVTCKGVKTLFDTKVTQISSLADQITSGGVLFFDKKSVQRQLGLIARNATALVSNIWNYHFYLRNVLCTDRTGRE